MINESIIDEYFEWMMDLVCKKNRNVVSFRKLLMRLHDIEFRSLMPMDNNRAEDGKALRWRFAYECDNRWDYREVKMCLDGPCTVLEMMVALALRCEEDIMDDATIGNRTSQWFWNMIVSLGLGSMTDDNFDRIKVDEIIRRFLDREYEPNGRGGLFTIRNCHRDLRNVEIFHQLCEYLNTIT